MGGVTYQISDQVQLYGGVRWFDASEVEWLILDGDNQSLNVEIGLRFYF